MRSGCASQAPSAWRRGRSKRQRYRVCVRLALVGLLAVLFATGLTTGSASATFAGRNGKIAYVLNAQIYTVNVNGSGVRKLTVDGSNAGPRWSADGNRIAFTRGKNIYVMNADGSGKRRVTSLGRDLQPSWSPDGRSLVFIRLQSNGRGDLFRIPSAGGTAKRLTFDATTTGGNDRPTWSPKGNVVLFLQYRSSGLQDAIVRTLDLATGKQRVVPAGVPLITEGNWGADSVAAPDWAPDGAHVFFLARCAAPDDCAPAAVNIMRSDLQTTTRQQLTDYIGIEHQWDDLRDFAAAPDGTTFIHEGCWNLILELPDGPDHEFCGIRPGGVRNAHSPDWQPRPL
jgi:Tol biopolymer transport system component